jgi:tetratricopeptide (TPR) repeat protein/transglutaminase-like putative cysteine protease
MARIRASSVVLLLLVAPVLRADDWPVARGTSHEPLPFRYDAAIVKSIPKAHLDDASACILYAATTNLLEADGTVETISHEITRLNSRKGIERLGEYRSIVFDPTYEKVTLNEAHILKPDGTSVAIEAKHVQLRDVATDFQIYDTSKQVVISFPNLEVGDVYEVKWTIRGKNREFDGHFFSRYTFGDDQLPVLRDEFRVRVPRGKTLKHASVNGKIDLVVTDADGEKLYHWTVTNRVGLPKDEDRPSREELRLQVMVSTFPSWEAVGEWKQKLRKDCWTCTPEVRKIVDEVTRGKEAQIDKAKALTYWVRRHIRYLSRGPAGLGYTPHKPHQVLDHLYGDCKDQAQLLAVMLREIGLPVWLVTLGTLDDGQILPAVPSPWGSHAILLTQIDGKDYWIDTTVSIAAWDFLPRADRNRQVYATKDGEIKLMRTPKFTLDDYRIEQTTYVTIQPDGTSLCKRESTYHHSSAWSRRDRLLEVPPGERRRSITAELQDAHTRAKLLSLKVDEQALLDFDRPVRTEVEFEIPKHFTGEGATREASFTDSPVWTWFVGYNFDPERKLPIVLPTPFESIHRYVIQVPPAYRLDSVPEGREIKSPWGTFVLKVTQDKADPRRLELHMHMRFVKERVETSELTAYGQFQDDVNRAYRVWLSLRPTINIADAPALEKYLEGRPKGDAPTSKILAKLYLDHDKGPDAQRVLEAALKHAPDDRDIWEMRVTAATSAPEEERLYRAMVKRFPSEARYAVALGAVCIRREEHAEAEKILAPLTEHKLNPIRGAAHYQLARNAFRQKDAAKALKHLQSALFIDSATLASMDALHFKARVHETLGQHKDAVNCMLAALEAEPNSRDTLEFIVRLELKADMKEAALDHLRRLSVAADKDGATLAIAAQMHLELGRLEDAFELAERARAHGAPGKAHRVLGLIHLKKAELPQAVFHLEKADLDDATLSGLAHAYLRLGDLDSAARRIPKKDDGDKELRMLAAEVAKLVARRDKLVADWNPPKEKQAAATRVVNRFLCAERGMEERWPREQFERLAQEACSEEGLTFAPALALRAALLLERGHLRRAFADADAAAKLHPTEARALLVRGRVRLEQGNVTAALTDLRRATEASQRRDAIVLHWFAAALLESGRAKEAIATQRLALLLLPDDAELQAQLRHMEMLQAKEGESR